MISIRKAVQQDSAAIKELIQGIMEREFPGAGVMYSGEDLEDPSASYGGKKDGFFVAEKDGVIVGTVAIKEDTPHTALLRRLFVASELRGKGSGIKLIEYAMSFCQEHGYHKVIFRGTDAMKAALKACMKCGFIEHDILELPHVKMLVLEKRLHKV